MPPLPPRQGTAALTRHSLCRDQGDSSSHFTEATARGQYEGHATWG